MYFKAWFIPLIFILLTLAGCSDHADPPPPPPPERELVSIQLTIDSQEFPIGITHTATAIGNYSDYSTESGIDYTWSTESETEGVATVDTAGNITGEITGNTKLIVTEQGITSSLDITISAAVPQSIEIFPGNTSIAGGLDVQYQAIVLYSDGEEYDITRNNNATWIAESAPIAEFSGNDGIAHTSERYEGGTYIDVQFEGVTANTRAVLKVSFPTVTQLIITPIERAADTTTAEITVPRGQTIGFSATAYYSNNTSHVVTDETIWGTKDETVIKATDKSGTFHGEKVGNTDITAAFDGVVGERAVEVSSAEFESIVVSLASDSFPVGLVRQATAKAEFVGDVSYNLSNQKNGFWQSSNTKVATVDLSGMVTMRHPGETEISFLFNEVLTTTPLEVTLARVTEINISPLNPYFVGEGKKRQLTVMGTYDNFETLEITHNPRLKWEYYASDGELGFISNDEGEVDRKGMLHNFPTDQPLSIYFTIKATMDGTHNQSVATFGATNILTNEAVTLNFIGPFTDIDAKNLLSFTDFSVLYRESGVTGPADSTFIMVTFNEASLLCDSLVYDDFDDYRLPTAADLQAVWVKYDKTADEEYALYSNEKWAVGQHFWTTDSDDEGNYSLVDLQRGVTGLSSTTDIRHYASCVRDTAL
ncbi:surface protein [Colwellia psychrerythraea]|uniref:Putative surface protein n=1 Tax=Colwellia psychrerythraea (strain 34H / ATCC BAA-681) TaxID=167879 RepID=Q488C4_COLP3|nr:surface protein [Colwellia psychrerythraea]AAZ24823.1 putative surface protein [Colwellia psychrerythraea 34H]